MNREEYAAYLQSPVWRDKRQAVIERCNGKCEDCRAERRAGGYGFVLRVAHVHHLTYDRVGKEDLADLVGLCERHHRIRHGIDEKRNRELAAMRKQYDAMPALVLTEAEMNAPTLAELLGVTARETTADGVPLRDYSEPTA